MSLDRLIENSIEAILDRAVSGGGFAQRPGGKFRADATAWSILAFSGLAIKKETIEKACRKLAMIQLQDGRIPIAEGVDVSYWPTPLAILAWQKADGFSNESLRAAEFLLFNSGLHFEKDENNLIGHDPSIRGWSWTENAHSWIEPTSMAILALKAAGQAQHERVLEAVNMILNRQLLSFGWNFGNTSVFDKELSPAPDHTGQALCALSGYVQNSQVQKSIEYAKDQLQSLRTPLSLCWCLFGLRAWSADIPDARPRVLNCLSFQKKFGRYDTTSLAQLIVAYLGNGDLLGYLVS